jgi:3-oxo-5-alpha-steroid 4-dehydrogenase 1
MVQSQSVTAASVALFGAGSVPFRLEQISPAAVYSALQALLKSFILLAPVTLVINAPFGRFASHTSILRLPGRLAFTIMELPSPILFVLAAATPTALSHAVHAKTASDLLHALINPSLDHVKSLPPANLILAALYVIHYSQRAVIQSIRSPPRSPSHLSVVVSSIIFNVANGFTMGSWIGGRSPSLLVPASLLSGKAAVKSLKSASWFAGILPRSNAAPPGTTSVVPVAQAGLLPNTFDALLHPLFVLGLALWAIGFISNVYHDEILFDLRRPEKRGGGPAEGTRTNVQKAEGAGVRSKDASDATKPRYEVPHGGLYRFISYPNYFSECEYLMNQSLSDQLY